MKNHKMAALFEKYSYDASARSGWHIRKSLLERTSYDNQSILFYDFGKLVCTGGGEKPLDHSSSDAGWIILLVRAGNAKVFCDRESFNIRKNDIFISDSTEDFKIQATSHGILEVCQLILLDSPIARLHISPLRKERLLHLKEPEKVQQIFQDMEKLLFANLKQATQTVLRDLAVYIFTVIAEISRQCLDFESKLTVRQIRGEIACNPWNNYTLPELSRMCGLSERSFEQQFRKYCGCSFMQYLIGAKISMACALLQTTRYSVDEIIQICNFRSKTYFYHAFKRQTGVTPLLFRGIQRNGEKTMLSSLVAENREETLSSNRKHILWLLLQDSRITVSQMAEKLFIHRSAVQKNLEWLKSHDYIRHNGSRRAGYWVILPAGSPRRRGIRPNS